MAKRESGAVTSKFHASVCGTLICQSAFKHATTAVREKNLIRELDVLIKAFLVSKVLPWYIAEHY